MTDPTPEEVAGGVDGGAPFEPITAPPTDVTIETVRFDVAVVKKTLRAVTKGANQFAGEHVHADLEMTEFEASLIAPGIVHFLESRPTVGHFVKHAGNDYLKAVTGVGIYVLRITKQRAKAIAEMTEMPDATTGAELLVIDTQGERINGD